MANIQQPITPMQDPAILQNPDYVRQLLQAQQRAKMADALLQQGMQPIEYDRRGRVSWTQGLAKALSAGLGAWGGLNNAENQAGLQAQGIQRQLDMLGAGTQPTGVALADAIDPRPAAALSQGAAQGSIGPTLDNAARMNAMPQPAQQPTNGVPGGVAPNGNNPYGLPPMLLLQAQMGNEAAKEQIKSLIANQQLTNTQKEWRDPVGGRQVLDNLSTQNMTEIQKLQLARSRVAAGSPLAQQLDSAIQKANYVAPAEVKQGNVALDRNNMPIVYNPKTADGIAPTFQTVGGVTMPTGARALPGYAGANASIAGAEQGARQANTVFTNVAGPDNQPISGSGWALFGAPRTPGQGVPAGGSAGAAPAQRPGVVVGANQQLHGDMGKRWASLYEQAGQAQNVISYLQQIKQLAPNATTGQFADRLQYINSLLSQAGSEKATDTVSAKNLLDKYSNQIVARLGQGGLGTDAARAIVSSAYPNSHMTPQAIGEAADNAIGAQQALQAKATLLQNPYLSANPQAYQHAETAFDQAADPRIFQWRSMPDGPAKTAFGRSLIQSDPSIPAKIKALQTLVP